MSAVPVWAMVVTVMMTAAASIVVAWINSRSNVSRQEVEGMRNEIKNLRTELATCKSEAADNIEKVEKRSNEALAAEVGKRRILEGTVDQLKDDLTRKNEELIDALIHRERYVRRSSDLKEDLGKE